jgi:hypothetical protein
MDRYGFGFFPSARISSWLAKMHETKVSTNVGLNYRYIYLALNGGYPNVIRENPEPISAGWAWSLLFLFSVRVICLLLPLVGYIKLLGQVGLLAKSRDPGEV